ncbi:uncharacterized protein LOC132196382 isoform X2 [Neocloeon triangulifer]|uniref:uncharacterized protein LOC132196382 isoform X2 n=1 Tax=Neocloeon triangulifer TaxID=2078957 RepID=UPI00286F1622|nr:uncharacterized protein LOC132196382 isoform X2 [Neocloeon triangulifer]XP_059474954.1 uncharacterized protein LOC132196382 isoform X2 [Neocloeon triangulifer]
MGKHYARMKADKRMFDSGQASSASTKYTYEEHLKNMLRGAFGKRDMDRYVDKFFVVTPSKVQVATPCCDNCRARIYSQGKTGIRLTKVEEFVQKLQALDEAHSAVCENANVVVFKDGFGDDDDEDNVSIKVHCPQCQRGGSFEFEAIKDPRLLGDDDFIEFRNSSFHSSHHSTCKHKNCC